MVQITGKTGAVQAAEMLARFGLEKWVVILYAEETDPGQTGKPARETGKHEEEQFP